MIYKHTLAKQFTIAPSHVWNWLLIVSFCACVHSAFKLFVSNNIKRYPGGQNRFSLATKVRKREKNFNCIESKIALPLKSFHILCVRSFHSKNNADDDDDDDDAGDDDDDDADEYFICCKFIFLVFFFSFFLFTYFFKAHTYSSVICHQILKNQLCGMTDWLIAKKKLKKHVTGSSV